MQQTNKQKNLLLLFFRLCLIAVVFLVVRYHRKKRNQGHSSLAKDDELRKWLSLRSSRSDHPPSSGNTRNHEGNEDRVEERHNSSQTPTGSRRSLSARGSEDENETLLPQLQLSQEETNPRNFESIPSTSAATDAQYQETGLSEVATTSSQSTPSCSSAGLMDKIEYQFIEGDGHHYMDDVDMTNILRYFKKAWVIGDYGPGSQGYKRSRYISEGFRHLIKLGEKEFNPQILLEVLRKYNLNYLADNFLKPICEKNGYDLEEKSIDSAEAKRVDLE